MSRIMVMKRSCALVVIASLLLLFISGCIDSSTTAPNTPPKAIIIALGSAIEGESADFDGTTSTASDGYIASYQWDFGDGQTGTGAKSPHIYSNAGTYVASLTVIDNHGLKDTDSIKIIVLKKTNSKPVAYGYITTITLDKMNTELIDVNDNYDKYEVEDNVGTINYRDYTYQTHRVTLWRNEAERIVNNVVAYELTTALPSSSGSKVFGYVTTITFDEKTELIKFSDNYDKYDVEDNVGTIDYRGYTYVINRVTLWTGDTKRIINNVVAYDLGKRNFY